MQYSGGGDRISHESIMAKMAKIKLELFDVTGLNIVSNSFNLRRDIHVFVDYVSERSVKRSHRSNNLSKTDATRLAKLMSDPQALEDIKADDYFSNTWVDYVDSVVLQLGFVNYDTTGQYIGYSSSTPSFRDNYIRVEEKAYNEFMALSLQKQENYLLDKLNNDYDYSDNEFFQKTPLTLLDSFDDTGCAVGILPSLDFSAIRRFMFKLLKDCQCDVWYSTASLVQYLKCHHPFFLIPKKPKAKRLLNEGRYGNFSEHTGDRWRNRYYVSDKDKDAFERVEGRYVERFLEGIPLSLGYVDVAYTDKTFLKAGKKLFPMLNKLKAFRLKSQFLRVIKAEVAEPKVTVQPNFEIHVESDFYPAQTMSVLTPLVNVVSEDSSSILLKLEKKMVAKQLVVDENLDVVNLLKQLSHKALPQNVVTELEEWAGHSEMFVLYDGLGLFEGDAKLSAIDKFAVEQIAPNLRIVKTPSQLYEQLEQAELVPLKVRHENDALHTLPKTAKTVFPKDTAAKKAPPKAKRKPVILTKQVMVTIHFPDNALLEIFRKDLLEVGCPVEVDSTRQTMTFPQAYDKQIKDIIKRVSKEYHIQLKNLE